MKKRITREDYLKANRKASREEEIRQHGHPVCYQRVHRSKRVYNRKKNKADDQDLPYFFVFRTYCRPGALQDRVFPYIFPV